MVNCLWRCAVLFITQQPSLSKPAGENPPMSSTQCSKCAKKVAAHIPKNYGNYLRIQMFVCGAFTTTVVDTKLLEKE